MRKIVFIFLLVLISGQLFSQYRYRSSKIEPGIAIMPMKSWWNANGPVETLGMGFAISIGYKLNETVGLHGELMYAFQQGIEQILPCHSQVPPCNRSRTRVPYLRIPIMYRYIWDMNPKIAIKLMAGPQASIYLGSQPKGNPYTPAVLDAAAGFEVNHQLGDSFYATYGLRLDQSIMNPEQRNALLPNGERYFAEDRKRGSYTNLYLVVGFHLLWER